MGEEEQGKGKISRLIQGVKDLFMTEKKPEVLPENEASKPEEKKIVFGKEKISRILPHRGRMLLLDEVAITELKVTGNFLVTEAVCEGHSFDGKLVFRGADILDMAAQLLAIWAAQYPDSPKSAFVRKYGEAKFQGVISPGDKVAMEVSANKFKEEITINRRLRKIIISAEGFSCKVGGEQKCYVSFVELVGI